MTELHNIDHNEEVKEVFNTPHMTFNPVPRWIEQDITVADVLAIRQGGCESGAYMPAVTYWQAIQTASEHENDIAEYLADHGETIEAPEDALISKYAVAVVSRAVELWAAHTYALLDERNDEIEDELYDSAIADEEGHV